MAKANPAYRGIYAYDADEGDGDPKSNPKYRGLYTYSEGHAPDGDPDTPPVPPGALAPYNKTPPTITGAGTIVNVNLALDDAGVWAGEPTITLAYQWLADNEIIENETNPADLETAGMDPGTVITLRETATNDVGSASVVSNAITLTAE